MSALEIPYVPSPFFSLNSKSFALVALCRVVNNLQGESPTTDIGLCILSIVHWSILIKSHYIGGIQGKNNSLIEKSRGPRSPI